MSLKRIALARFLNPVTSMDFYLHPPAILQLTGSDANIPNLLACRIGVNYTQDATFFLTTKTSVASTYFDDPVLNLTISMDLPPLVTEMVFSTEFLLALPQCPHSLLENSKQVPPLYPCFLTGTSLICEGSKFTYSGVDRILRISNRVLQFINALGRRSGLVGNLIHLVF